MDDWWWYVSLPWAVTLPPKYRFDDDTQVLREVAQLADVVALERLPACLAEPDLVLWGGRRRRRVHDLADPPNLLGR